MNFVEKNCGTKISVVYIKQHPLLTERPFIWKSLKQSGILENKRITSFHFVEMQLDYIGTILTEISCKVQRPCSRYLSPLAIIDNNNFC